MNVLQRSQENDQNEINKEIINQIMALSDSSGLAYLQKFNQNEILVNLERNQIQIIQQYQMYVKNGFNLIQFVRFFLNIIPHEPIQNLYLAIGVIDLFRQISMQNHQDKVNLRDLTNYMCDKFLKDSQKFNRIQAKYIPQYTYLQADHDKKSFMRPPPQIYGENDENIHKLSVKNIKTDSTKHSRAIIKSQFCNDLKKIFILDSLTEYINVYDENCTIVKKIKPYHSKLKKQVIILSFAFSQRQFRIGATLKDFTIKFWDWNNDFEYQKSISTTSICQNQQTSIYFLQFFNTWITSDKVGLIYFWNLLRQQPDRQLQCKYNEGINTLCQIPSLSLLVVVQQSKTMAKIFTKTAEKAHETYEASSVVLYNFFNGNIINQIDLSNQRIPHTLLYSQKYQSLFFSGLQKKIKVHQIHPKYLDTNFKGQLIGHQNLITSFTLVKNTPMILSADDKGKIKLWDFRNYTCLQTLDFSDKTVITNLLDMIQIGKMGIFGTRVNYIQFEDKFDLIKKKNQGQQIFKVQSIDIDNVRMKLYVYANKQLKVINLQNGQIKSLISFNHEKDDEFTIFRFFSTLKKCILGSYKGKICIFNSETGQFEKKLHETHDGPVSYIQFDQINKLFITVGVDSKIMIHNAYDCSLVREIRNNLNNRQVSIVELSVYHNMLVIGNPTYNKIYVINYEYGKISGEIQLDQEYPVALHVMNGYGLLIVGTNQNNIYIFRTYQQIYNVKFQLVQVIRLDRTILNVTSQIVFKGKGKNIVCEICNLFVSCDSGNVYQYSLEYLVKKLKILKHIKERSNYHPYREGKQNFFNQIQKKKHTIFKCKQQIKQQSIMIKNNRLKIFVTDFSLLNLFMTIQIEVPLLIGLGNDKRIKIWDSKRQLICDYNLQFCLPYKWNLKMSYNSMMTQKIYFAIKTLKKVSTYYKNDISLSQSKNLEIKELFERISSEQDKNIVMFTQPQKIHKDKQLSEQNVILLQEEFTKQDLHFDIVKKMNFAQIGGPTLKQLDNIKKIDTMQRQWKIKEKKQQKEKCYLLKTIEIKAKKNEEKQQIHNTLFKIKKYHVTESIQQNQYIINLANNLTVDENPLRKYDEKRKTFKHINRSNTRSELNATEKSLRANSALRYKKSFEQYYLEKKKENCEFNNFFKNNRFREILTEMNGRILSVKKQRKVKKTQ